MLDWIADKIMALVTLVPALFVAENSPHFILIRGMFALLLIVFVVYVLAIGPIRIWRYIGKRSH